MVNYIFFYNLWLPPKWRLDLLNVDILINEVVLKKKKKFFKDIQKKN